jgi:hypothetical protein
MMSEEYPEYSEKEKRWFRRVGDSIEYEPEITVIGGTIPISHLEEYNRKMKVNKNKGEVVQSQKKYICPFKTSKFEYYCSSECAYRMGDICVLTAPEGSRINFNCLGGKCPLSNRKCDLQCALYNDGCAIIKRGEE